MKTRVWRAAVFLLWCCIHYCYATDITFAAASAGKGSPSPPTWPKQFHALLFQTNASRPCAIVNLWYDWPNGRNLNQIASQLGVRDVLYDVEYDNHTSFYFDPTKGTCKQVTFSVGILRPDWLKGAHYNGQEVINTFPCHSFTQGDGFITYWSEVARPHRPVRWRFYDGAQFEVMFWDEGHTLPDNEWQAPAYCFKDATTSPGTTKQAMHGKAHAQLEAPSVEHSASVLGAYLRELAMRTERPAVTAPA